MSAEPPCSKIQIAALSAPPNWAEKDNFKKNIGLYKHGTDKKLDLKGITTAANSSKQQLATVLVV